MHSGKMTDSGCVLQKYERIYRGAKLFLSLHFRMHLLSRGEKRKLSSTLLSCSFILKTAAFILFHLFSKFKLQLFSMIKNIEVCIKDSYL